jgi:hypothetical protein
MFKLIWTCIISVVGWIFFKEKKMPSTKRPRTARRYKKIDDVEIQDKNSDSKVIQPEKLERKRKTRKIGRAILDETEEVIHVSFQRNNVFTSDIIDAKDPITRKIKRIKKSAFKDRQTKVYYKKDTGKLQQ